MSGEKLFQLDIVLYAFNNSYPYSKYFRINNDLLLWEPTAPSPVETVENMPYGVGLSVASQLINTYSKDSFSQFHSTGPEGATEQSFHLISPNSLVTYDVMFKLQLICS